MMMFWNKKKKLIAALQADLEATKRDNEAARKELAARQAPTLSVADEARRNLIGIYDMLKAKWVPRHPTSVSVQESIVDTLYGLPSLRALTGYANLVQIPFLIREAMPYKQVLVRTIVQLDFIRFIGRLLWAECPTAATAVECMRAKVFGAKGLKISAYSMQVGENDDLVKQLNADIKQLDDANNFKEWQKECFVRYHKDGECFLNTRQSTRSIDESLPELRMIEPDFIRPSLRQGQGHEDPRVTGGLGEDWSFGIHCQPYSWYRPDAYQVVYPPEWDKEEQIQSVDMFHAANKEHRNEKRGIPTYFRVVDDLIGVTVHREALRVGAVQRARITGIVQYATDIDPGYVKTDLAQLGTPNKDASWTVNPTTTYNDHDEGAHFLGLLPGREFVVYPGYDSSSHECIYKMGIQAIASYYHLPLSAFGLAEEHSYAASEVEKSTPDTAREEDQGFWTSYWERVVKRLLEQMNGKIDWSQVGIECKGPAMKSMDDLKQVQSHVAQVNAKLESRASAQSALGHDPADEDDRMEQDTVQQEMEEQQAELDNQDNQEQNNG